MKIHIQTLRMRALIKSWLQNNYVKGKLFFFFSFETGSCPAAKTGVQWSDQGSLQPQTPGPK